MRTEVLADNRVNAIVFGGFAALALAISIVGVAGVLAFARELAHAGVWNSARTGRSTDAGFSPAC